jgi:hypothetical protein
MRELIIYIFLTSVGLENPQYSLRDPLRWPRDTLYRQILALPTPTSDGRSVGIVCSRTKDMEIVSLTKVLVGDEWSASHPDRYNSGAESPVPSGQEAG